MKPTNIAVGSVVEIANRNNSFIAFKTSIDEGGWSPVKIFCDGTLMVVLAIDISEREVLFLHPHKGPVWIANSSITGSMLMKVIR